MRNYGKPRIVISKCIEFEYCRYNGQIIRNEFVDRIKSYVDFIPICPEYEIGLGVPREPIRIIEREKQRYLVQPSSGKDCTENMQEFSQRFLSNLNDIDGFLLKSQSPSCGIKDVKIYPREQNSAPVYRDSGFFGKQVLELYPYLAIEDEARLRNNGIKEHFLKKIFTFARFRQIKDTRKIHDMIQFHTENKLLFMSYSQKYLKEMGRVLSNQKDIPLQQLKEAYQTFLFKMFLRPPRCNSNINILQHAFGYVSDHLHQNEKQLFLKTINEYSNNTSSLEIPVALLKSWIIRFQEPYLQKQTFFEPYPPELHTAESVQICPSKDYWKS
jgi:uncharacterized protein YbgA (DUF1722 family)/uncharacterized protein YbbK (DUF523 family)